MSTTSRRTLIALSAVLALFLTVAITTPSADASLPVWPAASYVSATGQQGLLPQVSVAADGTATAVWLHSDDTGNIVQAASRPAHGTWQPAVDLSAPGQFAVDPKVAVAPDGTAIAIWNRPEGGNSIVQAATRPAGGAWQSPVNLSEGKQSAYDPQVEIGTDGSAFAIWERYDGSHYIIQARHRPAGGYWQGAVDLSAPGQSASDPQIAICPDGTAIAVWERSDGTSGVIQEAVRPPGGTWQSPTDLSLAGDEAQSPQVATGPHGTATFVWARRIGEHYVVQSATRFPGGTWTSSTNLSVESQTALHQQVSIAPDGTAIAVWNRYNGSTEMIQSAVRPPGGRWQSPLDVSSPARSSTLPELAIAPGGTATVVWQAWDGQIGLVEGASRPAGGSWTAPRTLSEANNIDAPQVSAGRGGTLAAVWSADAGSTYRVQATVIDPLVLRPQTSRIRGPRVVRRPAKARFRFHADLAGVTFQCRLDRSRRWWACISPHVIRTRHLKLGRHVLRVRAVRRGVPDPSPSIKRFKVV